MLRMRGMSCVPRRTLVEGCHARPPLGRRRFSPQRGGFFLMRVRFFSPVIYCCDHAQIGPAGARAPRVFRPGRLTPRCWWELEMSPDQPGTPIEGMSKGRRARRRDNHQLLMDRGRSPGFRRQPARSLGREARCVLIEASHFAACGSVACWSGCEAERCSLKHHASCLPWLPR